MGKIGILTFHYTCNYGGVLQALALQKAIASIGCDVEVINFVPSAYRPTSIRHAMIFLGVRKNIFKINCNDLNPITIAKKIAAMKKRGSIVGKFDSFRAKEMKLSTRVDEHSLLAIVNDYETIVVGSDQVWNPSQRKSPEYFLSFGDRYQGSKVSYAADSTVREVHDANKHFLKTALEDFDSISVRNEHSQAFVKAIIGRQVGVVADPTILFDFADVAVNGDSPMKKPYILTYVLGEELEHSYKAIKRIKKAHGDLPVYSIVDITAKFELPSYADKVFYDLDPGEWLNMFRNAKFIYTNSFHGVLFSLKYHKPFLAYYVEKLRATRFIDLSKRYGIEKYIIQSVDEIDKKNSIGSSPCFRTIDAMFEMQRQRSFKFLTESLK